MEDGRGYSGIDSGKSIGLAEGIRLPAEAVESNRSRPRIATLKTVLVNNFCCAVYAIPLHLSFVVVMPYKNFCWVMYARHYMHYRFKRETFNVVYLLNIIAQG